MVVITITHSSDADNESVFVDATREDGGEVALTEALGMLELAKSILLGQASL